MDTANATRTPTQATCRPSLSPRPGSRCTSPFDIDGEDQLAHSPAPHLTATERAQRSFGGKGRTLSTAGGSNAAGLDTAWSYLRATLLVSFGCMLLAFYHMDVTLASQLPSFADLHGTASSDADADADADAADHDSASGDESASDGAGGKGVGDGAPSLLELWHHSSEVSPYFEGRIDGGADWWRDQAHDGC